MSLNNNQQMMFAAENERFNLYFDLYIRKTVHKLLIYINKWRRGSAPNLRSIRAHLEAKYIYNLLKINHYDY